MSVRVTIERPPRKYHWTEGRRRGFRLPSGYIPVAHVPGVGAVKGPVLPTHRSAVMAASLIRQELSR